MKSLAAGIVPYKIQSISWTFPPLNSQISRLFGRATPSCWSHFEHCDIKMGSPDNEYLYSTLCPSIISTCSSLKFQLKMAQCSVWGVVMLRLIFTPRTVLIYNVKPGWESGQICHGLTTSCIFSSHTHRLFQIQFWWFDDDTKAMELNYVLSVPSSPSYCSWDSPKRCLGKRKMEDEASPTVDNFTRSSCT